jgi:ketosteroid isomerase-like protein
MPVDLSCRRATYSARPQEVLPNPSGRVLRADGVALCHAHHLAAERALRRVDGAQWPRDTGRAMSRESVETVQAAVDAINRGDLDAHLGYVHPNAEWETTGIFLEAGTYRGRSGVRAYVSALRNEFDQLHIDADVIASGDMVLVDTRVRAIGKRSRVPVDLTFTTVVRFKDGLIYRLRNFETKDRAQALEAVGLRE